MTHADMHGLIRIWASRLEMSVGGAYTLTLPMHMNESIGELQEMAQTFLSCYRRATLMRQGADLYCMESGTDRTNMRSVQ